MRRLITGMKMSLDGRIEGPQGYADWVQAWSEDYGITQQIDACVLGGGMYPAMKRTGPLFRTNPASRSGSPAIHPLQRRSNGPASRLTPRTT